MNVTPAPHFGQITFKPSGLNSPRYDAPIQAQVDTFNQGPNAHINASITFTTSPSGSPVYQVEVPEKKPIQYSIHSIHRLGLTEMFQNIVAIHNGAPISSDYTE